MGPGVWGSGISRFVTPVQSVAKSRVVLGFLGTEELVASDQAKIRIFQLGPLNNLSLRVIRVCHGG